MTGRIILDACNPALDNDGDPIPGSTLLFYQNNTATKRTVYKTAALNVEHANPVVADSAGRFPVIWAEHGQVYSVIWYDADGEVISTFNDIEAFGEITLTASSVGGTANDIDLTIPDFVATDGHLISFIAIADNTGATTVNDIDVVKDTSGGPAALDGGEIIAGNYINLRYDEAGNQFHLLSFPPSQSFGTISPAAITTTEHDYHPTGLGTAAVIRLTATAAQTITGIDAPSSSIELTLQNIGTDVITLADENTGSGAVNRFAFPADVLLYADNSVTLRYDMTSTRWRLTDKVASETALGGVFTGLVVKNNAGTPNTQVDLDAASVTMADTLGNVVRKTTLDVTINLATTGANALDAGAIAAATWYYIWAIYNPTTGTTAGLASTSATAPTMPSGYTFKARFGAMRTATGAATLRASKQYGRRAQLVTAIRLNSGSGDGDPAVPTWVACSVSAMVPPTAFQITVFLSMDGSANACAAAPNNAYGAHTSTTAGPPLVSSGGTPYAMQADWILESTDVYYASDNAGAALYCLGWEDNL